MAHNWHIIGRGAIGLLWASDLSKQHQAVTLIVKNHQHGAIEQTVELTEADGQRSQFCVTVAGYDGVDPIDTLVIPLKAYDVLPAIKQIKPRLTPKTVIILCHNGMGTIDEIQQFLGVDQPLLFASTTHGAYRASSFDLVHSGLGETKMGWINKALPLRVDLPQMLSHILHPVSWHDDINSVLWQKLAINCIINPLTATIGCKNGKLSNDRFNEQIETLCAEICTVANAYDLAFNAQQLRRTCYDVIVATANNFSSMHQDIMAKRKTEIDYINGFLLHKAQRVGIDVPANKQLFREVKKLEG